MCTDDAFQSVQHRIAALRLGLRCQPCRCHICNRLSRRKCNACAVITVLTETTVDGDIAWGEAMRENLIVYSEIGAIQVISFPLYCANASFWCATSKSQKTGFGVFYQFKMVSPHFADLPNPPLQQLIKVSVSHSSFPLTSSTHAWLYSVLHLMLCRIIILAVDIPWHIVGSSRFGKRCGASLLRQLLVDFFLQACE